MLIFSHQYFLFGFRSESKFINSWCICRQHWPWEYLDQKLVSLCGDDKLKDLTDSGIVAEGLIFREVFLRPVYIDEMLDWFFNYLYSPCYTIFFVLPFCLWFFEERLLFVLVFSFKICSNWFSHLDPKWTHIFSLRMEPSFCWCHRDGIFIIENTRKIPSNPNFALHCIFLSYDESLTKSWLFWASNGKMHLDYWCLYIYRTRTQTYIFREQISRTTLRKWDLYKLLFIFSIFHLYQCLLCPKLESLCCL